jgi:1-acyl-sn-glycerol-3-phosphate acyltransferase
MLLKYTRYILVTLYTLFMSFVALILCLVRPFKATNSYYAGRLLGSPVLALLGLSTRIENWKGLYEHRPCIFISNHQSNIDLFICGKWISPGTVSLGKKSIRRIPLFGQMYWLAGNILIDRANKKSALRTMDTAAQVILERNVSVWMMPEGTRHRGPGVKAFKKGPFYTAIKAKIPIVPVAYNRYSDSMDLTKIKSGVVLARVHDVIHTNTMTVDDVDALMERCQEILHKSVLELDREAEQYLTT